jgi:hypothetical protein
VRIPALFTVGFALFTGSAADAQTSWQNALAQMPMPAGIGPIERTNALRRLLEGLQSNTTVKAMIILPAVSDDLYLINRDKPKLGLRATNLLDAICQLTNATEIRATFRSPFLLLHRDEDFLTPQLVIKDAGAADRLRAESRLPRVSFCDVHWKELRPVLNKKLRASVLPWSTSANAWHFARHNLAGWNLTDWELITAVSLSGRTSVTIEKRRLIFQKRGSK